MHQRRARVHEVIDSPVLSKLPSCFITWTTSLPGSSPSRPLERERERPWETLVTCLPESGRHVTSVFQGLSLYLAPGDGKERTPGKRL